MDAVGMDAVGMTVASAKGVAEAGGPKRSRPKVITTKAKATTITAERTSHIHPNQRGRSLSSTCGERQAAGARTGATAFAGVEV
jgi:hypothetical protein